VPHNLHSVILCYARANGIDLTPGELVEAKGSVPRQIASAEVSRENGKNAIADNQGATAW